MSQTIYSDEQSIAAQGDLGSASGEDHDILTFTAVDDLTIEIGTAVAKETADNDGVKSPDTSTDQILGVALRDPTLEEDEDNAGEFFYPQGWKVPVVKRGSVYVLLEESVTPDDDVFVRFTAEPEVFTITWDQDFVALNLINGSVDGTEIAQVTFDVSHANTMDLVAAAIQALDNVATATVTGAREITVTGATDGDEMATATNFTVTLGAAQAVDTVANVSGPSSGTQTGVFRTDDDDVGSGATAVQLTGARFMTSGSAGSIALLDLNL